MIDGIKVVVVDDHPMLREGVVHVLVSNGIAVVSEGATADEAVRLALLHKPNVLLLDMKMPGGGLHAITAIVESKLDTAILVLTVVSDEQSVKGALRSGARGYILKGAAGKELVEAVLTLAGGERYVTPQLLGVLFGCNPDGDQQGPCAEFTEREEQILSLLSRGLSNKEIAFDLKLSEKTVKYYLTHVLRKLHVRNRVEAALFASQRPNGFQRDARI